ncbi:acetyl-CoA synthetase-like protein, protein [Acrodontium crateriforme]|uniref:Acetyl-CoA synthetase-like protein, protein n=1 Tax=Acrodontium crateriforme TaxID=150365 RepID=A0AAQ3M2T3_9PEZI|nr:acetyl-CoA synthetase-like protein, protein [Acrodontium crateriforme]
MIIRSEDPDLDIPKVDILTYLFPEYEPISRDPVWIDAVNPKKSLSPADLLLWVKRLGIGLDRLGIARGDIVLIYTPNHIFVPVAYLGIVGNTRAFSAVNPIYTVNEIVHQLKNSNAKALLVHPQMVKNAIAAAEKAGLSKNRIFQFNDEYCEEVDGIHDWRVMLGSIQEAETFQWKKLNGEASVKTLATVNYSSGTTGLPKGVSVSHHNLISNVEQTIAYRYKHIDFAGGQVLKERWIGFLPLYHAYGQLYANLIATKLNVPIYIMKQFVYTDFLQHIQDFKISHLQVAPPVLVMMTKRPETSKYDLRSIQGIICGAAPLSKELQNLVAKRFKVEIFQGWGMTELTCGSIVQRKMDDRGTVGKLIPNHECKLIDDDGNEVGYDTPGEMYVRSPNVCMGYFNNEQATKDSISEDGWLKTGDVAVVNKEGFFWIVDRKKELIKVNALQVAPAELEAALIENDDVEDAAVTGIMLFNEEWPRAYVQLKAEAKDRISPKDIQDWIASRVAKHKRLVGGVMFVDEVPKLASGKIQRKVIREWAKRDISAMEKELAGKNLRAKL